MQYFHLLVLALGLQSVAGFRVGSQACAKEDQAARALVQNTLAGICEDMCKDVGSYPDKCTCPGYVDETDKTPGETTWDELLTHMSDLVVWGKETRKSDAKMSVLQNKAKIFKAMQVSKACMSSDLKHRVAVQNKLHDVCVDMCKELGAYPEKCTCPGYVDTTDKTPDATTWPELLTYMGEVEEMAAGSLKEWKSGAR
mmetsp:Transcript_30338/g.59506  ORF Transcript_30338/g.59506 Transcript_30338/m.59506 type:complete len:198 (+) Transcript_30338:74-667(+)